MNRQDIIKKIKDVLAECFPEDDFSGIQEDTLINTDESIDSMGFVLVICKLEALFNVKIPERQWSKLQTLGDVADAICKRLPK